MIKIVLNKVSQAVNYFKLFDGDDHDELHSERIVKFDYFSLLSYCARKTSKLFCRSSGKGVLIHLRL